MAAHRSSLYFSYNVSTFFALVKTRLKQVLALIMTVLMITPSFAQQPQDSSQITTNKITVTVPAGTRIPLVLTHPVQSKILHRGDNIYAQIFSPVTVGDQVLIPPGTFVQGKIEKLERRNSRGEIHLQSMSLTFPAGYVANLSGPVDVESDEGYAQIDPSKGRTVGAFAAPFVGLGIGAAIGSAAHTKDSASLGGQTISSNSPKGLAIGSITGAAIGTVVSLFLLTRSKGFYLDVGSPVEMVLQQPLTMEQARVTESVKQSSQYAVPIQPIAQRPQPPIPVAAGTGICYTPGSPGTPDTDIPGTPAIGDSPGTPSIHIPGIPATPPTPYPCP